MNNKKATKRALLTSVMALVMCVVMLVGTTFAWFTDTASTAVNKIQAGNLDVALEMKDANGEWVNAEKQTMNFLQKQGEKQVASAGILWEPGAKFQLPTLRVANNGNLALKYKVVFSAVNGGNDPMKLAQVLDVYMNNRYVGTLYNALTSADTDGFAHGKLEANANSGELAITVKMRESAGNEYKNLSIGGVAVTVYATQDTVEYDSKDNLYDENADYPTITTATTISGAFPGVNFSSDNTNTEPVVLDGKGVTVIENWADYYFSTDTTIKGVTFRNGASFTVKSENVTVTLEDCTFYACDQQKAATTLGITDNNGTGNDNRNNILTNSGAGMCLNLEQGAANGQKLANNAKFIVKDCTFIGENDNTLSAEGYRYNANGAVQDTKKRGHAIALNAISGGGSETDNYSLTVEGCTINGVRGNAIQLYGTKGNITIKDTKINSWAVNKGGVGYAIRGDFGGSSRTLTLTNVYFGLNEQSGNSNFGHVKLSNVQGYSGSEYTGNTNGSRTAGTY